MSSNVEYTNFSMKITKTEKEIMDFVLENVLVDENYSSSKASAISHYFKTLAASYLSEYGLPAEYYKSLDDEMILGLLKQESRKRLKMKFQNVDTDTLKNFLEEQKKVYESNPNNKEDSSIVFYDFEEVIKELEYEREQRKGIEI